MKQESHSTHYDCAIVGGGLAGLSLAIQLAKAKKKVILFEKEKYPFHKVCGEYIAMESWDFLQELGVPLSNMNLPRITQLRVSSPSGKIVEQALHPGGFGISRYTLDNLLYKLALTAGVDVHVGTKVDELVFENNQFKLLANLKPYTAQITCGAFGKRSNLDVKLKRKFIQNTSEFVAVKYHVKANLAADVIELHNFKDGYCGISKVDNESYCLCYLTSAKNLKANKNNIKEMEAQVLAKNPFLQKYFTSFPSQYEKPLVISQISFAKKEIINQHMLLLGDAAGLITPLCGNGMSMALHSSKISFELVLEFLNKKISRAELEKRYEDNWNKHFKQRIKVGRTIQSVFGNNWVTEIFIAAIRPFPSMLRKLISLTHGQPF